MRPVGYLGDLERKAGSCGRKMVTWSLINVELWLYSKNSILVWTLVWTSWSDWWLWRWEDRGI